MITINMTSPIFKLASCLLILALVTIASCDEEEGPKPEISSIEPATGYEGDEITINGVNFDPANTLVTFNGKNATVVSATDTKVIVEAPAGTTTGPVAVTAFGSTTTGPVFTYKSPATVTIGAATYVLTTSVRLNGELTVVGSDEITQHGFVVYPAGTDPVSGVFSELGPKSQMGSFTKDITGLTKNTQYAASAYARTAGTVFLSAPISFKTANTNAWSTMTVTVAGPGDAIFQVSFPRENGNPAINGKAYMIPHSASANGAEVLGLYEFDPGQGTLTRMPDFPGVYRQSPVRFAIGDKLYVGMGQVPTGNLEIPRDLWRFTPATKTWLRVKDMPGTPMASAVSVVLNGKAYLGFGPGHVGFEKTFWEYDPATDNWTEKSGTPFTTGFIVNRVMMAQPVGDKGYFAFQRGLVNEAWEYAPVTDTWTRKNDLTITVSGLNSGSVRPFPGAASPGHAYLVDTAGDVFEYTPSTDAWRALPAPPTRTASGFTTSIDGRIYVGTSSQAQMYVPE